MIRVSVQKIRDKAPERPAGYLEDVLSSGIIVGDDLVVDEHRYTALCAKYRPSDNPLNKQVNTLPRLTVGMEMKNFQHAILEWGKAGFPVVTKELFEARIDICRHCPDWDESARFGMGKCAVCGCTTLKLWLVTSKCPIN